MCIFYCLGRKEQEARGDSPVVVLFSWVNVSRVKVQTAVTSFLVARKNISWGCIFFSFFFSKKIYSFASVFMTHPTPWKWTIKLRLIRMWKKGGLRLLFNLKPGKFTETKEIEIKLNFNWYKTQNQTKGKYTFRNRGYT